MARRGLNDSFVVMVSLQNTKEQLLEAFEKLLREKHKGKRGRPERDDFADWRLAYTPNITAIETALKVYKHKKDKPNATNVEVARELKINESSKSDEQYKVLSAQVSRYFKHAVKLIEGVERGIYPARLE